MILFGALSWLRFFAVFLLGHFVQPAFAMCIVCCLVVCCLLCCLLVVVLFDVLLAAVTLGILGVDGRFGRRSLRATHSAPQCQRTSCGSITLDCALLCIVVFIVIVVGIVIVVVFYCFWVLFCLASVV